jgi:hypothetical protein
MGDRIDSMHWIGRDIYLSLLILYKYINIINSSSICMYVVSVVEVGRASFVKANLGIGSEAWVILF